MQQVRWNAGPSTSMEASKVPETSCGLYLHGVEFRGLPLWIQEHISVGMMRYSCNSTLRVSRLEDQGKRVRGTWRAEAQQCLNQPNLFLQVLQVVILRAKLEK